MPLYICPECEATIDTPLNPGEFHSECQNHFSPVEFVPADRDDAV